MADDFRPAASWEVLRLRSEMLRKTRDFFHKRGFIEVETPLLSHDVVVDRHLDPVRVTLPDDPRKPDVGRAMWLQTSPEFGMKRLMAAGGEAIFQITRAFRGAEQGSRHNPEFTIVEWYRRGDSYQEGMALLADLSQTLLCLGPARQLTYEEAFRQYAAIEPHQATAAEIVLKLASSEIQLPQGAADDRDMLLDLLLTERIEPHLGFDSPTILCDYPPSQAALAQVRDEDPPVAERFELYVRGIELANGYHELLDPQILRERNEAANELRAADGKPSLPVESRLLAAMDHGLPQCTGCALGFDRVVMIAAGKSTIDEVMAFPIDRA
jgi:elongation factor P--(R)-beta-lysine ligase